MNNNYAHIITLTLGWLTVNSIYAAPVPPPFVVNGNSVTTPDASGTYNKSFFKDTSTGYSVLIEPISGQSLTLKNKGSVIRIGDGSNVTINGDTTLKNTSNDEPVVYIKGNGNVTNNGGKITGENGVFITQTGTITNSGKITGTADYGVQLKHGQVTNSSTGVITAKNGTAISTDTNTTVINQGTLKGKNGIEAQNNLTVNNSGKIKAVDNGISVDGNATITNSGKITASDFLSSAISIQNKGTVNNSGTLEGFFAVSIFDGIVTNSGLIDGELGVTMEKGSVTNSGKIEGDDAGVSIDGKGSVTNSGKITAFGYGVSIQGKATVINSGTIKGQDEFGVSLGDGGTLTNSGVITGRDAGIVSVGNKTTLVNSGKIVGTDGSGMDFEGDADITNSGRIKGKSGPGIVVGDKATIFLEGGSIKGAGAPAIITNTSGGNKSTVTIDGRAKLNGEILSAGDTGKLNLNLVGMTPEEADEINALSGKKKGDFFIGSNEYQWQNFKLNANAVSLETVVDPGLKDIATKIDDLEQGLPLEFDPLYVAAANNPEGALNNFTSREFFNAFIQVGLSSATTLSSLADERAFSIRSGASGVDLSGLNINSGSLVASLDNVRNVLNQMSISDMGGTTMSDSKDALFSNSPDCRWGVWASGAVTVANNSGSFSDPSFHTIVGSPTIGFDYHLFPELVVGALVNYTTTGVDFTAGSQLNANTYLFGGYADWSHDHWFANGLVAGGYNSYDQSRNTVGGTVASSSPDGTEVIANASGGYDFKFGSWMVSPEAALNYTHLEKNSYSESGGGAFDLDVAEQDVNSLRTVLGVNVTNVFKWDGMKIAPTAHASWYHECLDNTYGINTSVPGAPALGSFVTTTTPIGRNFALVGAGISITPDVLHDAVTFFLNYDAQVGQDNYIAHTGDGGLRIGF